MKRLCIDGVYYRMRRGKLVPIPTEWVGKVMYRSNINKRSQVRVQRRAERDQMLKKTSPTPKEWD